MKYKFSWDLLGNVSEGRPNLGNSVDVVFYRLMQFTLRDVIEKKLGVVVTDQLFYEAGKMAGKEFFEHYIAPVNSVEEFVKKTQEALKNNKIGILRIEEAALELGKFVLTVDEDLECSGLPEIDSEICIYDEGFISSLFENFTKESWSAKEIDCWCNGARICRFLVTRS